jgi:hypothetical protein
LRVARKRGTGYESPTTGLFRMVSG